MSSPACAAAIEDKLRSHQLGLTDDYQKLAFDYASTGQNCLFHGEAGSGKTVCLRSSIGFAFDLHGTEHVIVVAIPGVATENLGIEEARTLASAFGLGHLDGTQSKAELDAYLKDICSNKYVVQRVKDCKVLFFDETGMLSIFLFNLMFLIFRVIRGGQFPFDLVQLVLCGDVLQIAPFAEGYAELPFFFESVHFATFRICEFPNVYRNKGLYLAFCRDLRLGDLWTDERIRIAQAQENWAKTGPNLTIIFQNVDVYEVNEKDLVKAASKSRALILKFPAVDGKDLRPQLGSPTVPRIFKAVLGSPVMALVNMRRTDGTSFSNGTMGTFDGSGRDNGGEYINMLVSRKGNPIVIKVYRMVCN